jgi:hypothetical protein
MKLSFSKAKGKGKYTHLLKFLKHTLPKLKDDGGVLKAFADATGAPSSKLESGLRPSSAVPLLQVMPTSGGDIVAYLGNDKLLLAQDVADLYERNEDGLLGKGSCLCQQTSRGNWDSLEIEIVRGLALWGCGPSLADDERQKRSFDFIDAVFGPNRPDVDHR